MPINRFQTLVVTLGAPTTALVCPTVDDERWIARTSRLVRIHPRIELMVGFAGEDLGADWRYAVGLEQLLPEVAVRRMAAGTEQAVCGHQAERANRVRIIALLNGR